MKTNFEFEKIIWLFLKVYNIVIINFRLKKNLKKIKIFKKNLFINQY